MGRNGKEEDDKKQKKKEKERGEERREEGSNALIPHRLILDPPLVSCVPLTFPVI